LERQVRLLRKNGIKIIRIVTGYRSQDIEQFNKQKNLGLELVHNPNWDTDGVNSLIMGVQDLDDDLLIVYGDVYIGEIDLNNILKCDTARIGHHIYKFGKQHIGILKRADELRSNDKSLHGISDIWHRESKVKCPYDNKQGLKLGKTILKIYRICVVEEVVVKAQETMDADYFRQTAEALGKYPCKL